ncbi:uncharacterized protein LOC130698082 [Daphnia carinata]|uniref:uncharacterized protein LOC130698082 n=1 Tax=Daphnia carinata TaxID=120202 RepID=UPI00257EDB47|nr:uncharacterized protein LOC130698082 [Daphnia carinata]
MARFSATQFGVLVLVWSTSYVVASLTVDMQLEQLRNNYMKLEQVLASKDSRLEFLEQKVQQHGNLEAQITRLVNEVNQMKTQVRRAPKLELKVQRQESLLNAVHGESRSHNVSLRQGTTQMPKSCADLKNNGHTSSGMFLIMGIKMVETVFCDFSKAVNDPSFQKWIGFADVKSFPVYFHAQRIGNYGAANTVIPFNQLRLNVGNALNPVTGVFIAPKAGKYFFAYSGLSWDSNAKVQLQMKSATADWSKIGEAHCTPFNTFALQSSLELKKGDEIRIIHIHGVIHDRDGNNFSNFVGLLLEEDVFGC